MKEHIDSIPNAIMNQSKSMDYSLHSLENALDFRQEKKNYNDYKTDKLKEMERQYKILLNNKEYEKGVIVLRKLLFFESENPLYYSQLADLYIKLYDISSAISYYKKSLLLKKKQSTSDELDNLLFAKGMMGLEDGKINKEIMKQINYDVNKSNYVYLKAIAFISVGKIEYAIRELEKIILLDDKHVEALLLLGKIYMNIGRYKESSLNFWRVHNLNPNHSEIKEYVLIMKIKMQECLDKANENILKRKTEMGLLWCIKALSMYPNHPEALLLRSAIFRKIGKYNEALQDLNLAAENMLVDNSSEKVLKQISLTYNELGLFLIQKKNYMEASKFLDEAIKFNNNDIAAHFNKGECYLEMKELNKALDEYKICLQFDANSLEAKFKCSLIYYKYAIICFNNKDFQDCIENINRAFTYYSKTAEYYVLRARCYMKMKSISKAYEDIDIAVNLNPANKEATELKKHFNYIK